MNILHALDHSLPLHSGYTFRTAAMLWEWRARAWDTERSVAGYKALYDRVCWRSRPPERQRNPLDQPMEPAAR